MCDNVPERRGEHSYLAGVAPVGAGARSLDENSTQGEQGRVAKERGDRESDLGAAGNQRSVAEDHRQSRVDRDKHETRAGDGADDDRLERQRGFDQRHRQQHRRGGREARRRQADADRERRPAADRDILRKGEIAGAIQNADRDERREGEGEERKMLRRRQAGEQQIDRHKQQRAAAGGQSQEDEELLPFALNRVRSVAIVSEQLEPAGRAGAVQGRGKPQDDTPWK